MEPQVIDLQKAIAGGKALDPRPKNFLPPTAFDLRLNIATAHMNAPDVQGRWAAVMTRLLNGFMKGEQVIELTVPKGGAGLLETLGYFCSNVAEVDGLERVGVSLYPVRLVSQGTGGA